jgi:ATP-dependent DNA helicase RecQ
VLYGEADLCALEALPAQRFPEEEAILDTYRDLTHFLQIPSGDGDMEWYDFPLDTFLSRFQKNATTTLYALKALEQEELVLYSDRANLPPMCGFTASRVEVERAQSENPVLAPLVDALLRNYPGILNHPSRISEERLSRITRLEPSAVSSLLTQMDRSGLLSYSPPVNAPRIRLLQPRVRLEDLRIDYGRVLARKEVYTTRLGRVIEYLTQRDVCRSRYLAAYFGSAVVSDCGVCDVCVARRLTAERGQL